jgi:uncharacterized membrane protein
VETRWGIGRVEDFSDGVFAIAITLLVLDLAVPERQLEQSWRAIPHEWPGYLAYLTSFATIGGIWLAHNGIFRRLQTVNGRLIRLNLLLLLATSFLPFPTRLAAESIRSTSAERSAIIFYGLCLLAVSLILGALWSVASRDRTLLRPEVTDADIQALTRTTAPNVGFYIGATILAIFFPRAAALVYLIIAVTSVFRARTDHPTVAQPVSG